MLGIVAGGHAGFAGGGAGFAGGGAAGGGAAGAATFESVPAQIKVPLLFPISLHF